MEYLAGWEAEKAMAFIDEAARIALRATCFRSKCGSIVVKDDLIIGRGYNSPPCDVTLEECLKDSLPDNFKSDKTCCLHAEQRAVMDALRTHPAEISGSRLYFVRLDDGDNKKTSGQPYCTICSKMALDSGVSEFVLWHEQGVCVYDTKEYNDLSFKFRT